jgi:hypothetical protein
MNEKIQVKEIKDIHCDQNIFLKSFDELISFLQSLKDDGWEGFDSIYKYREGIIFVYRYRPETDEEYNKRIKLLSISEEDKKIQYEELFKSKGE